MTPNFYLLAVASKLYIIATKKWKPLWPAIVLAIAFHPPTHCSVFFYLTVLFPPFQTLALWGKPVTRLPDSPSSSTHLRIFHALYSLVSLSSRSPRRALRFRRPAQGSYSLFHTPVPTGWGMAQPSPSSLLPLPSHCIAPWHKTTLSFGTQSICCLSNFLPFSPCLSPCSHSSQRGLLKIRKPDHVALCLKPPRGPHYTQSKIWKGPKGSVLHSHSLLLSRDPAPPTHLRAATRSILHLPQVVPPASSYYRGPSNQLSWKRVGSPTPISFSILYPYFVLIRRSPHSRLPKWNGVPCLCSVVNLRYLPSLAHRKQSSNMWWMNEWRIDYQLIFWSLTHVYFDTLSLDDTVIISVFLSCRTDYELPRGRPSSYFLSHIHLGRTWHVMETQESICWTEPSSL